MQLDPTIPFFTLGSLHFGLHLVDGTVRTINRVQTHWQATSRPQISSMEVVAAVSSVAGIASLVGQSLNGLNKLYEFVSDCRNASRTVTRFRDELTTLRQTIEEVEALVLQIKDPFEDSRHCTFNSLTFHLENCANNLHKWFEAAQKSDVPDGSNYKNFFSSILVAIRSKDIKDIFKQISSHRQAISLSLSATGRYDTEPQSLPCSFFS
jgi:hypothetical protein